MTRVKHGHGRILPTEAALQQGGGSERGMGETHAGGWRGGWGGLGMRAYAGWHGSTEGDAPRHGYHPRHPVGRHGRYGDGVWRGEQLNSTAATVLSHHQAQAGYQGQGGGASELTVPTSLPPGGAEVGPTPPTPPPTNSMRCEPMQAISHPPSHSSTSQGAFSPEATYRTKDPSSTRNRLTQLLHHSATTSPVPSPVNRRPRGQCS
jgi:hypothetical protein